MQPAVDDLKYIWKTCYFVLTKRKTHLRELSLESGIWNLDYNLIKRDIFPAKHLVGAFYRSA